MEECDFVTEIKQAMVYKNTNRINKTQKKANVNKARTLIQRTCIFEWMRYNVSTQIKRVLTTKGRD